MIERSLESYFAFSVKYRRVLTTREEKNRFARTVMAALLDLPTTHKSVKTRMLPIVNQEVANGARAL